MFLREHRMDPSSAKADDFLCILTMEPSVMEMRSTFLMHVYL